MIKYYEDFMKKIMGKLKLRGNLIFFKRKISIDFYKEYQFNSVQSLSRVRPFATPWTTVCQASLSITNAKSLCKLMSIESVMPSNHLILCRPCLLPPSVFPVSSHLQSFPASGSFPMSQFFTSGIQSIEVSASASVLSMNSQD